MILGITSHRPKDLGGYSIPNPIYNYVRKQIEFALKEFNPEKVITGMAEGGDQIIAELCIQYNIPFIAAIPFQNQADYWSKEAQNKYLDLISHADAVEVISNGGFANWKYQVRNEWIVNNSDIILAVLKPNKQFGGTVNCVKYAKEKNKRIIRIDPNDFNKK